MFKAYIVMGIIFVNCYYCRLYQLQQLQLYILYTLIHIKRKAVTQIYSNRF